MKIVSFKVAKSIKEAGYPQSLPPDSVWHYNAEGRLYKGELINDKVYAPTYLEVWLWLWREKKVELSLEYRNRINDVEEILWCFPLRYRERSHPYMKYMKYIRQEMHYSLDCCSHGCCHEHADPEEAIIAGIEYLVEKNLIK